VTTTAAALPLTEPRTVSFEVFGIPKPKGSARGFVAMKAGKARAIVVADNSKALRSWEGSVRDAAQRVAGEQYFTEAVRLRIDFWFPRPKSVSVKKRPYFTTKPDLSKLVRSAEDALNGVVFKDDCQVVEVVATKRYADGPAGARVTVSEVL
jgi:Holliday junction resolvase RusA-like endonuclease